MLRLNRLHHISVICSDYKKSLSFYTEVLGFKIIREIYREGRLSFKADLEINGAYLLELFSFPVTPSRLTQPEATGLRHLAFEVESLDKAIELLKKKNVKTEAIRLDESTGKRFTFLFDPDELPIELYEC